METQGPAKPTVAPRPSRLANISLALGICAALAFFLLISIRNRDATTGIFFFTAGCTLCSLFLGITAWIQILKLRGLLTGQGRAVTGIVLGLLILAALLFPCFVTRTHCPGITKERADESALTSAMEIYQAEYSLYPGQNATNRDHYYSSDEYRLLLATLRGSNFVWNGTPSNPRGIVFLSVDERSIVTTNIVGTAQVGEFADPWGNRYEVVADWNFDNKIDAPLADGEAVQQRGVAVWSYGPKGKAVANSNDSTHIRSWR